MKRPAGVTILAVIAIIYGIFRLLVALLGLLGLGLAASGYAVKYSTGILVYATILDVVFGIAYLAFGFGAFSLRGWAWTTGVVALVLDILRNIVSIVMRGFSAGTIIPIITIVIALVLLWYLFRPNVRAAFRKAA